MTKNDRLRLPAPAMAALVVLTLGACAAPEISSKPDGAHDIEGGIGGSGAAPEESALQRTGPVSRAMPNRPTSGA